jgi:two-component system phosphate regulon sensor histidine kinase PhoR
MRRLFRRSILWLLPVVVVPLGVLLVMQYRFLRTLERNTASAERNWLRSTLEDVSREIEGYYRTTADRTLTLSPDALQSPAQVAEHFRRNPLAGAKTYFTIRYREMGEASYFDAHGKEKSLTGEEAQAVKIATVSWAMLHKLQSVVPTQAVGVDERDPRNRVLLKPIADAGMHVTGVAGVVLDNDAARTAMLQIAARTAKQRFQDYSDFAIMLGEPRRFSPRGSGQREFISQPLPFLFTDWRVGIRDICASPEEIAGMNFRINAMWTGVAAAILLAAIALATHAVARQAKLSQMKSDFVSNVSHELRTPLSSIRVFGEYMRLGRVTKTEKIVEYGEYIEAESRRLTQLINNILDFSKIESADKKYHFAEADLVCLVGGVVAAFEMPLREKGFAITFEPPSNALPPITIDKDALAQAVVNLLDNAVKYSGEQRDVAVRITTPRESEVRVEIRDHGIGIAPSEQKKIFDKFYRVGSGLVHDVKGSGLGLAIVSHIVKAHGGRVEVASTPGEGSTFTIVLPLARTEAITVPPRTEYA